MPTATEQLKNRDDAWCKGWYVPEGTRHQHESAGLSVGQGLNFQALLCGIFWSSSSEVFCWVLQTLPLLYQFLASANQINKKNEHDFNSVKINGWCSPSLYVAHKLHVICTPCVANDLCKIAPWPHEQGTLKRLLNKDNVYTIYIPHTDKTFLQLFNLYSQQPQKFELIHATW